MGDFHQLVVWQKAHRLALEVYRATSEFPQHEMFGLTTQARRAGVSIPANIAEGCGRGGDRELIRFLRISLGSASELEYHLLIARELSYLSELEYANVAHATVEVKRMLRRLLQNLIAQERDSRSTTHDS
jgi:four helix bundle protein